MASSDEPKPTAVIEDVHFSKNPESGDIEMDAAILFKNPTSNHVPLMEVDYSLVIEGQQIISGLIPDTGSCQSHGKMTFDVLDIVKDEDARRLKRTFSFTFKIVITIDLPFIGKITITVEKSGETSILEMVPISKEGGKGMASSDEPKPTAVIEAVHFSKNPESGDIEMDAAILFKNPTSNHVPLMEVDYSLVIEGQQIISGLIPDTGSCQSHGKMTFDVLDIVKDDDAGRLIRTFSFTFKIVITVDLPFIGKITITVEKSGETSIPETVPISKEGGTTRLEKNK